MGTTQGNSLCSNLYTISSFMFFLLQNWRTGGVGAVGTSDREDGGQRGRRMNMLHTMRTYVCKCKYDTC
jgi:hypothetical protein